MTDQSADARTRRKAPAARISMESRNDIRPYRVSFTDADLAELKRRVNATRWPDKETVNDLSQGVPMVPLQELARYWGTDYNWRTVEARINAIPNFVTTIDGLDIQFFHVKSKHPNALPVIITHGWPGSVIEQMKIIDPLVNPTAHGGTAADAFDVVIPSMPGYGFSGKPTTTGWNPEHIARAWVELMKRLGYTKYVAQGGDWGSMIVDKMGVLAPSGLLAIHNSMPAAVPAEVSKALASGSPPPSGLSSEEMAQFEKLKGFFAKNAYYAFEMATRNQTLTGIADSPVGLAAWLIDHGDGDAQPAATILAAMRRPRDANNPNELSRDDVLDNITLYWLTNTGVSSGRLYWENKEGFFDVKGVTIPVAVTVFPGELYQAPRTWAERAYPKLIYYHKADKGGHFAAFEQPELFAMELRSAFKSLR
ncbi:MAG TPA: alpha/beta fold hydrolase [Gemmatimonadaceae bacterium]|nr:alpha/beta fold hydrolase [Gemmatimonadaceae bacterium]